MGDATTIEWTDATWNPVRGCAIVSKGCTNCYAMRQAHRSSGPGGAYEGLTQLSKGGPVWTGAARSVPGLLDQPLRWRRPRRIFVNSMSDLFHEDVPDSFIEQVWRVMGQCAGPTCARPHGGHIFQILTKRPARMLSIVKALTGTTPLPNVWLGVSVEDQAAADERIPLLLQVPAAVRWISAEPLLGPVDLEGHMQPRLADWMSGKIVRGDRDIDWVVAGGESGPGARPMHPDWARQLRDDCALAGVPFFFKQWGAFRIGEYDRHHDVSIRWQDGKSEWFGDHADIKYSDSFIDDKVIAWPASKKSTGRQLDERTHDEYPE